MASFEEHKVENLYEGVRGLAVKILNRVERTDSYLDKLLDHELKNSELSGADKALLYEIVHGVVRWMGRLDWILNGFYKGQFSKAIPNLKNGLRVALYQILFLDKVPDFAAVNEAVEFVKRLQGQKPADLTNAILRNIIRSKGAIRYPDPKEDLRGYLAAYYSHPSWMVKRYIQRLGNEETEKLLEANNDRPYLTLKINKLKTNEQEFKDLLKKVNLRYIQGKYNKEYFRLQSLTNITAWEFFTNGYFDIQDESAGFSCKLIDPKPGERILDMCAAPGGKTAFLAGLSGDQANIVALEKFESRVAVLDKNLTRLEVKSVKTKVADALEYEDELFDKVLLDAPCSGTGTLSKKPDIKWKKELLDIHKMNELQYKLIEKAASMLKEGGVLVYSTCSIETEENGDLVKKFLANHPEYELEDASKFVAKEVVNADKMVQTYPHKHQTDGAFCARLIKKR